MKRPRYRTCRQKACQQCSDAKVKCSQTQERCTRCIQRNLLCVYIKERTKTNGTGRFEEHQTIKSASENVADSKPEQPQATTALARAVRNEVEEYDLVCPINAEDIGSRWLNSYIPLPNQRVKDYPTTVTLFISRILKSYAAIAIRGRAVPPPFVHSTQSIRPFAQSPLLKCFRLLRVYDDTPRRETNLDILQNEMSNLFTLQRTYDDIELLSAFQAYLIYSLFFFFRLPIGSNEFLGQAMINLQELASASSKGGLVCLAEQQNARPRWESWILAEAKRRTLYTMYLYENIFLAQECLPSYLGTELQGLPAPAGKDLWEAQNRREWETAYNLYLADWPSGGLRIDELWPIPSDLGEAEVAKRRARVDKWLENIDEFGTMLYAVTSITHGG